MWKSKNPKLTLAKDDYGFAFKINNGQLKITENNKLIVEEIC